VYALIGFLDARHFLTAKLRPKLRACRDSPGDTRHEG
jgi:hypothetical protein